MTTFGYALFAQVRALAGAGVHRTSDVVLKRKVVLVNVSALVAIAGCIVFAAVYGACGVWGLLMPTLLQLTLALCCVAVWTINRCGYFQLARVYFFSVTMALALGSTVLGQGSLLLAHYYFLLLAFLSLVFFKTSERYWTVAVAGVNTGLFLFFEWRGWPSHPSVYAIAYDVTHLIQLIQMGTCIVVFGAAMLLTEFMMDAYVQKLDVLGRTDLLTGLPNRTWFQAALTRELSKVQRSGGSIAIALLDLDHFKAVNDEYGHAVGDEALKHVAKQLKAQARAGDFVARMGGEEFIVLMQASSVLHAQAGAERLRACIAALPFTSPNGPHTLTASVGVALYRPGISSQLLMRAADRAMYRAKHAGRNQVAALEDEQFSTQESSLSS